MNIKQVFEAQAQDFTKTTLRNVLSDDALRYDRTYGITETIKELSGNIIKALEVAIPKRQKAISEARNDVKAIILSSMLSTPPSFKEVEVREDNKKPIIARLIDQKDSIKIATKGKTKDKEEFRKIVNEAVDKVFTLDQLNNLVKKNMHITYQNILMAVSNEIEPEVLKKHSRSFSVNVRTSINELLTIENIIADLNLPSKESEGTYYLKHPNGKNKFPDYQIFLKDDDNGNYIRRAFKVSEKTDLINVEGKSSNRVVGKQTSPERFRAQLKDDELFQKIIGTKIKKRTPLNSGEVRKVLEALDVQFNIPTVFVNLDKETVSARIREINLKKTPAGDWEVERSSAGQLSFIKDGTKYFGIEIGSTAYGKGGEMEAQK